MATDEKKKTDARTVTLKRVRLSFTDTLYEKKATVEDGTPKYGCNILIIAGEPNNEANKALCMAAVKAAGEEKWKNPDAWKGIMEDTPKRVCYRPGSRFKNQETGLVYQGYEGNMAISAGTPGGSQKRPKLMDRRKRVIGEDLPTESIPDVMYGGTYADVIVSFYGTDKGGRGIFATIEGIRSHEEGERMGGGGVNVTKDMFEDMDDGDSFGGGDAGDADDMIG